MSPLFEVIPIPAFRDNYIWLLHRDGHAAVVDPGDAAPVRAALRARELQLGTILVTHHHDDHTGGIAELLHHYPHARVYAPHREKYAFPHTPVGEDDVVELPELGLALNVMETPGHTLGHVVYYGANSLFCGDTLFSCGCGRLFEGTCQQLYHSLQRLAELPHGTLVYCTHEYTLHNIRFASTLDPDNPALQQRQTDVEHLIGQGHPSLPSTIGQELATNPFLRCDTAAIQSAASSKAQLRSLDPVSVFCAIRQLRNSF